MSNTAISETEDDPEVYESSGDEWDKVEETKTSRRASQRISKRPRTKVVESASDGEEDDENLSDEEPKKRKATSKNGVSKKKIPKKAPAAKEKAEDEEENEEDEEEDEVEGEEDEDEEEDEEEDEDEEDEDAKKGKGKSAKTDSKNTASVPVAKGIHRKFIPKTIYSEDYATGSFVILKKDAQAGDPSKHPSIWRIDGKALLQKYEAFDEENKVRHKNTSIYTGWSPMDKDLYAPVTVDVVHHNNQNLTVELHWDKLKELNLDSD